MKYHHKAWGRLLLLASALSLGAQLVLYGSLPAQVPIHWSFSNTPDGWGNRWIGLLLAVVPLLVAFIFYYLPKARQAKHPRAVSVCGTACVLAPLLLSWLVYGTALGWKLPANNLLLAAVGVLLVVSGNYMPTIRPNGSFGIRFPWIRWSPTAWRKTHRFGGGVLCIIGGALALSGFSGSPALQITATGLTFTGLCLIVAYSLLAYKKVHKEGEE